MGIFLHDKRTQEIMKALDVLFTATTGRIFCTTDMTRNEKFFFVTITSLNRKPNKDGDFEKALAEVSPQISLHALEKNHWLDDDTPIQVAVPLYVDIDKLKDIGQNRETKRINENITSQMQDFETGLTDFERVVAHYSESAKLEQALDSAVRDQFKKLCKRMTELSAKLGVPEITREQVAGIKAGASNSPHMT